MPGIQTVSITAHVVDGAVQLESGHPELERGYNGEWTFLIRDGTAPEVMFQLGVADGSGEWTVSSALTKFSRDPDAGDGYDPPKLWVGTGPYVSEVFTKNQTFRLDVKAPSTAAGTPPSGGGIFVVEDAGGGLR